MAIFTSTIAGDIRGSINGMVFSRNRGGAYIRNRVTPVNPNTNAQQTARAATANLTSRWFNVLTTAQREAWDNYASNVNLPNSLGFLRNVGGLGMYIRSNVPRSALNVAQGGALTPVIVDDAPTVFNLGEFTPPTVMSLTDIGGQIALSVAFNNADEWANENGSAGLLYLTNGVNTSRNYRSPHLKLIGKILGDGTTPPSTPFAIADVNTGPVSPVSIGAGQAAWIGFRVTRADGRLSDQLVLRRLVA